MSNSPFKEYTYFDCELMRTSAKAAQKLLVACAVTGASLTDIFAIDKKRLVAEPGRTETLFKVKIPVENKQLFKELSGQVLRDPPRVELL